ncbi:nucleolar protein 8 isoform X1 [Salmo salar]|uniref:Nucleolar protein 8 isoform X1 n=1 Tax=Salmo salar TaxID=8030 RepID=A0A1S3P8C2_SALSA|nr:nucleolar protein 8 isoform X1 [Salmo salar]XP_014023858.2 nucleolar protein 8 isoform X1 [Salmo salar]
MKRLYIGGLSHTITQKDLKDRFGKFGDVQDVELRTRSDDEGVPYKTFGYINLEITDADFKKCMTVLNKSKWKGGTIQIEQARETFLQKLAQERHEAAEKIQSPGVNHKVKLVESMKEAGVENFHMKAAVPGTEIPGHKDWVVSKFGRVLPVLNLKCQGRNKFIKYDPSKHSHNIKKLESSSSEVPEPTPVSQLTWQISGGDDDISKKRRGEFPPQKTPAAKKKKDCPNLFVANGQSNNVKSCGTSEKGSTGQKCNGETRLPTKPKQTPASKKLQTHASVCVFDSGDDSDGDIRMSARRSAPANGPVLDEDEDNLEVVGDNYIPRTFLTQRKTKDVCQIPRGSSRKNEEDYDSADTDEILNSRKTSSGTKREQLPEVSKTQEKTEVKKQTNNLEPDRTKAKKANKILPEKAVKKVFPIMKVPSPESDSEDEEGEESNSSKAKRTYNVLPKKKAIEKSTTPSQSDDDSEEESDSDSSKARKTVKKVVSKKKTPPSELSSDDTSEASADSEYEALFSNCQRLEFSLDDLQQLVRESFLKGLDQDSGDDDDPGSDSQQPGPNRVSEVLGIEPQVTASKAPVPLAKTGNGNTPEEILAAIFEEDNSDEVSEKKKKKKKGKKKTNPSTSLPAFQGTKALLATSSQSARQHSLKRQVEEDGKTATSSKKQKRDRLVSKPSASGDDAKTVAEPSETKGIARPPSSSDSGETTEAPALKQKTTSKAKAERTVEPTALKQKTTSKAKAEKKSVPEASSTSSSGSSSLGSEEDVPNASRSVPAKKTQKAEVSKKPQSAGGVIDAQQQDNQKRLAAQEQRQKEVELQKKLIQEALAKLDSAANGKHHIKFSSDEEDEEEQTSPIPPNPKKTLFQDSQSDEEDSSDEVSPARGKPGLKDKASEKLAGGNLFDDDDDEEEKKRDGDRFQIKPQFEGKAGAKLMQLQSRFGTDERFQMDHRFIDSDEDEDEPEEELSQPERECELEEEKKKSLDILNNLLNINVRPSDPNKPTAKGKTFRDISALQYDPTKEEHAAFETKNVEPKKDSKLARKKKREEAEKLPEVSRAMYYDVSMDLKEVFGTSKEEQTEEEEEKNVAWDKEEEETSQATAVDPVMVSSHLSTNEGEASSGFKFSFFGGDTAAETNTEKEEYHIETLKGAKVSWQVDPRFQDSSDEEEQEEEEEEQIDTTTPTEEPLASKKAFFFFQLDDKRLKEGPKAFCRSSKLEDQREEWEEKRTGLKEEYRKKHKDARRKLKTSQRN